MSHIFCLSNIPFQALHKINATTSSFFNTALKLPHLTPRGKKNSFFFQYSLHFFLMLPDLEKPGITEIQVRMDCNGCVQKIKKALHGINGIYDLYIDFPQQKLIIIGWADPEKIVKAIKKTRKIATICSHTEPTQEPPPQNDQPAPQEGNNTNTNDQPPPQLQPQPQPQPPPPHESANPPPPEPGPPPEQAPPADPPMDQPPPENPHPPPEPQPSPVAAGSGPKDVGEVHVIYHHPPDYGYRYGYGHHGYNGYWNKYHNSQGHPPEGPVHVSPVLPPRPPAPSQRPQQRQPVYVAHNYNMYTPSPYVTEYHEYVRSPPPPPPPPPRPHAHYYSRMDSLYDNNYHIQDQNQYCYYNNSGSGSSNGNITSIFSDENPNACKIM